MNRPLFPEISVNGEVVDRREIAAEAQHHSVPAGKPGLAWRKAANALVVRALLLQRAREREIVPKRESIESGRIETEEEALIRALLESEISVETPTDNDINAEWSRDPSRFRSPPLWEVSHILIACGQRDQVNEKRVQSHAEQIAEHALTDPKRFAQLAKEHSQCDTASCGGFLGQICPGDTVPEFETALRNLAHGEITSDPIRTQYGFHVIRMDARADGAALPFEAVRTRISESMEKAAWAQAARAYVNELIFAAEITGTDLQAQ